MHQPSPRLEHGSVAVRSAGLVKRYGDGVAVDGLSLEISAGECFGLLGPNSAGKTTTIEILAGLTRPVAGDAKILGAPTSRRERSG
jgi:ABC-2 type transport system ATP-binding protein